MPAKSRSILAVVAHPDDELLGVGGTLIRHIEEGDLVHLLILGDGEESRDAGVDVLGRREMADSVAKALGASSLQWGTFKDNEFDSHTLLSITKVVEQHIERVKPQVIYTHHLHDLNIDHRLTAQAVMTAARPMEGSSVDSIMLFETVSSTEWQIPRSEYAFTPSVYVNIAAQLEKKLELLNLYDKEMRPFPHPRSYEGVRILAQKRGTEVGFVAAEAFELVRLLRA